MNSESPQPDFVLDFTLLPIDATTTLLREIGMHLLSAILQGTEPQLRKYITSDTAQLLVTSLGYIRRDNKQLYAGQPWWRRWPATSWSRWRRFLRWERRYPFEKTVHGVTQGNLSQLAWHARVKDELQHQFDLHRGYRYAPEFWGLLGERAWADLEFQRDTAVLLENTLRQRTPFSADLTKRAPSGQTNPNFPVMYLSPKLYWILLTMAIATTKLNWTYRIWPSRRYVRKAILLLKTMGLDQGLQPGWATMWDQWVLLEAAENWGTANLPESVAATLSTLPLADLRQGGELKSDPDEQFEFVEEQATTNSTEEITNNISQTTWATNMPYWFKEWNQPQVHEE